jgi:membrane protein required for colicin V production
MFLNLSLLDWLILALFAVSIARATRNGFVREAMGLSIVIAGLLIAAWFYRRTAPLFKDVVRTENLALFCAFFGIFLGTLIVGTVILWLAARFMKFAKLQWFDRLLGAAFGFIRGWVLAAVILLGLTAFDVQTDRVKSSQLAPYFLPGSRVIAIVTPYDLKARFLVGYRAVERWWREQP